MRPIDYVPLYAAIVLALCIIAITVLAVMKLDIPNTLQLVVAACTGFLFAVSAQRGTAPPNGGA